jgi:hypothetical protein
MTDFRLLGVERSAARGYVLTRYRPGLRWTVTNWFGRLDQERRAYRRWVAGWRARGHPAPAGDPSRPPLRSIPRQVIEGSSVVALTAMAVAGTGSPWGLVVAVPAGAAARLGYLAAVRRGGAVLDRSQRRVDDPRDTADLARAVSARESVLADWPRLGALGAAAAGESIRSTGTTGGIRNTIGIRNGGKGPRGTDPRGTLDLAVWDLAAALHRRTQLRAALTRLDLAATDLPPDDPGHDAVDLRRRQLRPLLVRLNADVADRIGRLERLAEACRRHVAERAAAEQAREATASADAVLDAVTAYRSSAPADAAAWLSDRTTQVLAAYRELVHQIPVPDY